MSFETIQDASDATFTYNGIQITRSTNTVDDLITGVTIKLTKEDSEFYFDITQDLSQMSSLMQDFVDSYNETVNLLKEATKFDSDTGEQGSFQGDARVSGIQTQLNRLLFKYEDGTSLVDYGLDTDENGVLYFDSSTFQSKMEEDPEAMEAFFKGTVDVDNATMLSQPIGVVWKDHYYWEGDGTISNHPDEVNIQENVTIPMGDIFINGIALDAITLESTNTTSENAQVVVLCYLNPDLHPKIWSQ